MIACASVRASAISYKHSMTIALPPGVTVFERGWLSANNILFEGSQGHTLIDSGYTTHAEQTVALVRGALGERALTHLLNTHLHSDQDRKSVV